MVEILSLRRRGRASLVGVERQYAGSLAIRKGRELARIPTRSIVTAKLALP
jgi:hypothetical protein